MRIFAEKELSVLLREMEYSLESEIENLGEEYLLNVNEQEFLTYIENKYYIEGVTIHWDDVCYHEHEKIVRVKDDFREYIRECKKSIITIEVPYLGNKALFQYFPNPRTLWSEEIILTNRAFSFDIMLDKIEDSEYVNREYESIQDKINKQLINVSNNINDFNSKIIGMATKIFQDRKDRILSKRNNLMKINIPLKVNKDVSKTFSIPPVSIRKSISVHKPAATTETYKPEPTLDESMYREILKLIDDMGKEFERLPSTSKNKGEEDLRDFLLLMLQPHFKGSATGETFNCTGKTDILLRYENSNVFVGECKFWKGEKGYLATIDQLLDYLTWRDSKVAVIMFVRNRDFTKVIEKVKEVTPKHSNYISYKGDSGETWFDYKFHLNGDKDRNVHLAVMVYNIPD